MPRYQITFTHVEGGWDALTPDQQKAHNDALAVFVRSLAEEQQTRLVFFHPREAARTVERDGDGAFLVREGTFYDGAAFAGGYYVVDVDSMEEAVAWARRGRFMPGASEVRQLLGDG